MDVAHPADDLAAGQDLGGTAGLEPRVLLGVGRLEADLGHAQGVEQLLDHALGVEEVVLVEALVPRVVGALARHDAADVARLVGEAPALVSEEDAADLVERDVGDAVVEVVGNGAQEPRQHVSAHLGLLGHERADDPHGHAAAGLGDAQASEVIGRGEVVRGGLREPAGAQHGADLADAALLDGEAAGVVLGGGQGGLDVALAPEAHDLLDEVDLTGQVRPVGGSGHDVVLDVVLLDRAAKALESGHHERVGDGGAGERAGTIRAKLDARRGVVRLAGVDVHDARADLGATALLEERRRDLGDVGAVGAIDLALVADGGLAHEVEVAAGAGGVAAREVRALEKDVHGLLRDLGVEPAHDAGERDRRVAVVGDEAHVVRELALLAVKRHELLAVRRGADHDVAPAVALCELAQVEGVERLPGEVHHVVGHVHDVVDRAPAGGGHALGEPLGRGADLHVADHARGVARAELGVVDRHVDEIGGVRALLGLHDGQLDVGVLVEDGRDLHRHAGHGEAVGAVGRDLAVDHGVGHAEVVGEVHAHRRVLGQDHDALVVRAQAQLAGRAVHAAGLDAAQLALLDLEVAGQHRADHGAHDVVALVEVLGAADNLQRHGVAVRVHVLVAHADLAEPHVVGVGVGLLAHDLGRDHVLQVGADLLHRLDLGAGAGELRHELGGVLGHVHHGLEPLV